MAQKAKKKFDWNTFLLSPDKMVIHCTTEQEAKQCLELLIAHGFRFRHSFIYYWNDCQEELCFSNQGSYSGIKFYNKNGNTIFKFSAYDFTDETERT